jgi:hypothetical protein
MPVWSDSPKQRTEGFIGRIRFKGLIYSVGGMVIQSTLQKVRVSFDRKRVIDAKTRQRIQPPDPYGMSGGAMFGARVNDATVRGYPSPKLIGIMTDCPPRSNEIFGPSIAIVMAIIRDIWGVAIPARLQASNLHAKISVIRPANGPAAGH